MEVAMKTTFEDAVSEMIRSPKFKSWGKLTLDDLAHSNISVGEKHFTPQDLAEACGVSAELVRQIFRSEKGVLKIGKPGTKYRRPYLTLRIPESVAGAVHRRLSE
jgi:hypothetical protein